MSARSGSGHIIEFEKVADCYFAVFALRLSFSIFVEFSVVDEC